MYKNSEKCVANWVWSSLTTATGDVPICIATGDAAVLKNGHVFNGIVCPPLHYDLVPMLGNQSSSPFKLTVHSGNTNVPTSSPPSSTTSNTAGRKKRAASSGSTNAAVTPTTSPQPEHVTIHSEEEEREILGLFDSIEPKRAYLIRYDSAIHASCRFHSSSKGLM